MEERPPTARDLVRTRSRSYKGPDTGRMHHIGAAPDEVPVHTEDGVTTGRTTAWQLADRTVHQLRSLRESLSREMSSAAELLDFERAAQARDELASVEAELGRRSTGG